MNKFTAFMATVVLVTTNLSGSIMQAKAGVLNMPVQTDLIDGYIETLENTEAEKEEIENTIEEKEIESTEENNEIQKEETENIEKDKEIQKKETENIEKGMEIESTTEEDAEIGKISIEDMNAEDTDLESFMEELQIHSMEDLLNLAVETEKMAVVYLADTYTVKASPSVDAQDVVTVKSGQTVIVDEMDLYEGEAWFQVHFALEDTEYQGYIEEKNLAYSDERLVQWKNENLGDMPQVLYADEKTGITADVAQFPASYQRKLAELKQKHPNWVFVEMNTGLDWNQVVYNELTPPERSLVETSSPAGWQNGLYSRGWSYATEYILKYYLDPRNFLDETEIYMFEQLTYNPSYHSKDAVQRFLNSTFMAGMVPGGSGSYAELFYNVGAVLGVSPFHLASRVYQEQGRGTSPLISGTYPGYEGYYNYFNIGATGSTDEAVIKSGLSLAKKRGWSSVFLSIYGGAQTVSANYILKGQDTLYLQKFDVESVYHGLYWHQYMQNICAPASEARSMRKLYEATGAVNNVFVFKIPVYNNMPTNACGKPIEFTDVYAKSWQYDYVSYVTTNGIMTGKSNVTFAPDAKLSRCELALILYNIANKPQMSYEAIFWDVPAGQWYSTAVIWANKNKIVSGYGNGYFGTTDHVTREQMALMMYKMAEIEGMDISYDINVLNQFTDQGAVQGWAKAAMAWAVQKGLISGKGNQRLDPAGNATRAEAAAILYQYLAR